MTKPDTFDCIWLLIFLTADVFTRSETIMSLLKDRTKVQHFIIICLIIVIRAHQRHTTMCEMP